VTYELRWYAHRTLRGIYAMELEVHLNGQSSGVTLTLKNNRGSESEDITFEAPVTSTGSYSTCGSTKIPETPEGQATTVCLVSDVVPSTLQITKETCGKTFTFLSAYRTSLDSADARAAVRSDYENARALAASGSLLTSHIDGWSQLWQSGIEVSGRPDVAVAVNASLYAILSSVRDDWPYGLAPGGLTNYYNGHSFWDTETWMYPPLLFLHPQISQQLLRYRFDRIDGAKKKAASYSPPWSG
jgi:trehalose/maltose hydrolase-like predicted phosphorylase